MTAFLAIVRLTCRSAFRSNFFRGTILFFIGVTLLMPLIVKSDGTAVSMIKITLEYSLTLAAALLSISAVWLGASEITADVEDKRLQMVAVKPVARPLIYLAKFTGILAIHALLLLIAAVIIYALTFYRVASMDFAPGEKEQLYAEILTARRIYQPDPAQKNIDQAVEEEIRKHLEVARMQGKDMPDDWKTVRHKTGDFDEQEIRRRLRDRMRLAESAIAPGAYKDWTYSNLPENLDGPVRIRYKTFFELSGNNQDKTHGVWGWKYHFAIPDSGKTVELPVYFVPDNMALELLTMQTTEFEIAPRGAPERAQYTCARGFGKAGQNLITYAAPYPQQDTLMVKDGKGQLRFLSLDKKGKTLYFAGNGPELLVPVTGFFNNYCRTVLVLLFLIMAFAAMGMAFSACFSLASGIFLTLAYLIWGISTRFVLDLFTNTAVAPHNILEKFNYYAGKYIDMLLFDPSSFAAQEKLSSGELVEFSYISAVFVLQIVIKILPVFLVGLWVYSKRELALAGKDR
ncbi:MAG: hypothetical protein J6T08_00450 [Lentisphaeria bacterium]|nr:hypothetical protein [Lentisphaeria bacterium]